jgi:hypothetical protein
VEGELTVHSHTQFPLLCFLETLLHKILCGTTLVIYILKVGNILRRATKDNSVKALQSSWKIIQLCGRLGLSVSASNISVLCQVTSSIFLNLLKYHLGNRREGPVVCHDYTITINFTAKLLIQNSAL